MLTAMGNVLPSHLMDRKLYPFTTLAATGSADADGDRAFDDDVSCAPIPATNVAPRPHDRGLSVVTGPSSRSEVMP